METLLEHLWNCEPELIIRDYRIIKVNNSYVIIKKEDLYTEVTYIDTKFDLEHSIEQILIDMGV
jgi:hypothetical protein